MRKKNRKEKNLLEEKLQEKQMYKETLDILVKENDQLKKVLSEMKLNVAENKIQLQEKINSITDRDTAVAILSTQIDLLKQKFNDLQSKQKMQSLVNKFSSEDTYNNMKISESTTNTPYVIKKKKSSTKNIDENKENTETKTEKIEKQKLFLENQDFIQNNIQNLKREVNFLKQKIDEHKNNFKIYQYNVDVSNYLNENDITNLKNFFKENSKIENNKKLLYLVSNDGNVFKIKRRNDLTKNDFINKINFDYFKKWGNGIIDFNDIQNNEYINNIKHEIRINNERSLEENADNYNKNDNEDIKTHKRAIISNQPRPGSISDMMKGSYVY